MDSREVLEIKIISLCACMSLKLRDQVCRKTSIYVLELLGILLVMFISVKKDIL